MRPIVAFGCALAFVPASSPAFASTDAVSAKKPRCVQSNDRGENGAKGCFLDYAHGNDDGLWVKDIDRGGSGVAYVAVFEKHWYSWTHEAGETDGPDRGGDRNMKFDIGADNDVQVWVCVRYPGKNYGPGTGDGCHILRLNDEE